MLWHKAWLETRFRFISALVILTLMAGGNVYDYLATERLLPMLNSTTITPADRGPGLAGVIADAIELQKDFRGFVFFQAFKQNLTQMGVLFAVLLGCGGLLAESKKGSALFTLSLPITRKELLTVRTATGLAQCFAIAMIPPLVFPVLAPSIGQRFSIVDSLAHGVCLFFVGALFYSLATFLSTMFADIARPMLIAIFLACLAAVAQAVAPEFGVFRVMSGESYFRTGALPWVGLLTTAVLASALLYGSAQSLERTDF